MNEYIIFKEELIMNEWMLSFEDVTYKEKSL